MIKSFKTLFKLCFVIFNFFNNSDIETLTQGLDDLDERCSEYERVGAKFTKWRAVINIGNNLPSQECIDANMDALAQYAKIAQKNNTKSSKSSIIIIYDEFKKFKRINFFVEWHEGYYENR